MRYKYIFIFLLALASFIAFLGISSRQALVYDCFLFYNEVDLLQLRLEEMGPYVDRFVIVEAEESFRGNPKPLHFPSLAKCFEKFADKIIYVPVKGHFEADSPWKRERFQRDQILQGLKNCKNNDIIFISDVDEIVRGEKIPHIVSLLSSKQRDFIVISQDMYFGYANRYQGKWNGSVATTYADVKRLTPRIVRKLRHRKPRRVRTSHIKNSCCIEKGGWHFSSLGGIAKYREKIQAFSHAELDTDVYTSDENLNHLLKSGALVPLDDSFPAFLRVEEARFRSLGYFDEL